MGPFEDSCILFGTTHGTADTQALVVNPLRRSDIRVRVLAGAGIYIVTTDAATRVPSGITAATLDIRSTAAAAPYKLELVVDNGRYALNDAVAA